MTSINNNIPTRTFVPTTTKQPTNTNNTASAGATGSTGTSVPTPTSGIVYTACAPKTIDTSKSSRLLKAMEDAKNYLDDIEAKRDETWKQMQALWEKISKFENSPKYNPDDDTYLSWLDEYNQLEQLHYAYVSEVNMAEKAYAEARNEYMNYTNKELYGNNGWNFNSSTITGSPTVTTPPRITSTTGNVPYYPTAS